MALKKRIKRLWDIVVALGIIFDKLDDVLIQVKRIRQLWRGDDDCGSK